MRKILERFILSKKFILWVLILANASEWMAMDIFLPYMPQMVKDLETSNVMVQSLFIISFIEATFTPLFWGPLSDKIGRRKTIIPAIVLCLIGQLMCIIAPNIELILLARIIQYFGVGGFLACSTAIIGDMFEERERSRVLALFQIVWPFSVVFAPVMGAYIANYWGWRSGFAIMLFIQSFLFGILITILPETITQTVKGGFKRILGILGRVFKNFSFVIYSLIMGATTCPYMIFSTNSSFIYIEHFGYQPMGFAAFQSLPVIAYLISVVWARYRLRLYGEDASLNWGFWMHGVALLQGLLIIAGAIPLNPFTCVLPFITQCLAAGFVYPVVHNKVLSIFPQFYGASSAVCEVIYGLSVGVCMLISSLTFYGDPFPIIVGCSLSTLFVTFFILIERFKKMGWR